MRRLVLVLAVGCSHPSHHQPDPDAAPPPGDVASQICDAPAGTANVLAAGATSVTFGRMFAGGIWNTGPVTGVASPPFSLSLIVTNSDLAEVDSVCCGNHAACCTADGLVISSDPLPSGGEPGAHPIRIERTLDSAYTLTGTIDITTFVQPFEHAPGRIAGSVSAVDGTVSVSGNLDNTFCSMLLTATI